ncbi:MAG: energy transducer TonB [Acidobacteriia bacterium]|nr:energy transducer TonB [Terriglobia bacterium]
MLRRLRKQPQVFVPPQPSHQVKPVLTASERRLLTHAFLVDVKVYVDESGRVQYAELLSSPRPVDVAAAAVSASRSWRFIPAHRDESNVPGEVILHFRFAPAEAASLRP